VNSTIETFVTPPRAGDADCADASSSAAVTTYRSANTAGIAAIAATNFRREISELRDLFEIVPRRSDISDSSLLIIAY
jgi:hypothetical protein